MKFLKGVLILGAVALLVWGAFRLFKEDSYVGFYYPDANNLINDIQSESSFHSLEGCRAWVKDQVATHNPTGEGYDYECGKNCKLSGGKPYVCEETLE
jgi:hypothetical protein